MEYFVVGPDGQEYGPANLDSLKQWVGENRIDANTMLKDSQSGATIRAAAIPGLIPASPPPMQNQPPAASYIPPTQQPHGGGFGPGRAYNDEGWSFVTAVGIRCAISLAILIFTPGVGLFTTAYALYYAVQGKMRGHRHGTIAIAMAVTTAVIVGITIAMRGSLYAMPPR